jgi:hypothetical protein
MVYLYLRKNNRGNTCSAIRCDAGCYFGSNRINNRNHLRCSVRGYSVYDPYNHGHKFGWSWHPIWSGGNNNNANNRVHRRTNRRLNHCSALQLPCSKNRWNQAPLQRRISATPALTSQFFSFFGTAIGAISPEKVPKNGMQPMNISIAPIPPKFLFDYKVIRFFPVNSSRAF